MHKCLVLFLLFLFIRCGNKNEPNNKDEPQGFLSVTQGKTIEIPIPEDVFFSSFLSQVVRKNDTLYLLRQRNRTKQQGIDLINLSAKKYVKAIFFPTEGDMGVGKLASFYYVNKDSILLLNRKSVLVSDETGIIKLRKSFIKEDDYFPTLVSNKSKSFIKNNVFYFCKVRFSAPTSDLFFKTNNIYSFNLNDFTGKDMPNTAYPELYQGKCWSYYDTDFESTFNEKNNELLFTFSIDDNIYRYSIDQQKIIETVKVRSKYKKRNNNPVNCDMRSYDEKKHNYTNFYYQFLIYDKYKDLYYRISFLPIQDYSSKKNYTIFDRKFVLEVLNNKLELIGESDILNTNHEFVYNDWFITEEGLWVSTNNPKNKDFNEDILSYALLKFM